MTKKQEWFSLAQANLKFERGNTYVSVRLRQYPDKLPSEMFTEMGRVKLISEDGIEQIENHIKKEGVPVSNQTTYEGCNLEAQLLGFTLSSYYFAILRGGPRRTYQLAQSDTVNGSEAMKVERRQGISEKIVHGGRNALLADDDE